MNFVTKQIEDIFSRLDPLDDVIGYLTAEEVDDRVRELILRLKIEPYISMHRSTAKMTLHFVKTSYYIGDGKTSKIGLDMSIISDGYGREQNLFEIAYFADDGFLSFFIEDVSSAKMVLLDNQPNISLYKEMLGKSWPNQQVVPLTSVLPKDYSGWDESRSSWMATVNHGITKKMSTAEEDKLDLLYRLSVLLNMSSLHCKCGLVLLWGNFLDWYKGDSVRNCPYCGYNLHDL